ncbi:MoxR-like ATPase [Streptohalobacillus salinus]|uniref:MoxR-like ATPase n=2 Tax=Streptohalobacillus salinus TaxID=621096 RepID=A0A2V3WFR9_9BACI|nr:MoxR-like ATPase [Streptohalobacillus salinus]
MLLNSRGLLSEIGLILNVIKLVLEVVEEREDRMSQAKVDACLNHIEQVIIGKRDIAQLSLTALLAGGHVLLEDVPGVGKTMLVRALAKTLGCHFSRIQFTPDLLPTDVTGVSVFNPKTQQFEYRKGPIVGDIVLADEINRTSPKTQSALLEAMEESSVTVDGQTIKIDQPFFVMATQNPIEYEGTYPLPEAQLDRFLMKLEMGYPTLKEEIQLMNLNKNHKPIEDLAALLSKDDVVTMQQEVEAIHVDQTIQTYIVKLAHATRGFAGVKLGVSPRGAISMMQAAKALSYTKGRTYVLPDDVLYLMPYVWSHRLILTDRGLYEGLTPVTVLKAVSETVDVPLRRDA